MGYCGNNRTLYFLKFINEQISFLLGFDGILYGIPEHPIIGATHLLSPQQCRRLAKDRILEFEGREISISKLHAIQANIPLEGSVRKVNGGCANSKLPFTLAGKTYSENWVVVSLTGSVVTRKLKYDPNENKLNIDERPVHVAKEETQSKRSTYFWDFQLPDCLSSIQKIYEGTARHIIPRNQHFNEQLMVNDPTLRTTFGLDLREPKMICNTSMYQTQISNIYVVLDRESFIPNIQHEKTTNRLDNLGKSSESQSKLCNCFITIFISVGLITYNYISRGTDFVLAVQEIAKQSCLNTHAIIHQKLESLREHPMSAVLEVFGYGYAAIVKASAVYVWRCIPVQVEINNDLDYDTDDIPVKYKVQGEVVTQFADSTTLRLKNNTKKFPSNSVIHPSYRIENVWYCKTNTIIVLCDTPPGKFTIDVSTMRKALDDLHNNTVSFYDGGFNDRKSRAEFSRVYSRATSSDDILFDVTEKVVLKDKRGVRQSLGIPFLEDDIFAVVYGQVFQHPFAIKIMLIIGGIIIGMFLYLGWSCVRIFNVRELRSKATWNGEVFPAINYYNAIFNHRKMDYNINEMNLAELRAEHIELQKEIQHITMLINQKCENKIVLESKTFTKEHAETIL